MNSRPSTPPTIDAYHQRVQELLEDVKNKARTSIERAAVVLAKAIAEDRLIHVYGVGGHSVLGTEEMFWRAGGLACINPLFENSLMLSSGGRKSTWLERTPGVGGNIVKAEQLVPGDVLVLTSIYGMNAATIDAALEVKSRGASLIAITSVEHARETPKEFPARHPSGKNLDELADVTIDNHVPHGDAVIGVEGVSTPLGPVSTILVSFCIQWLVLETVSLIVASGRKAPVWSSANVAGGDEFNREMLERYGPRVKAL